MTSVVIIEDDPMVMRINREYVNQFPQLEVTGTYRNGREALADIRRAPPQLIILDVYMPQLSGIELLRILRAENIKSDVIMVTAANEVSQVDEALKMGIVDYLVKPFAYRRFCEAIENFLDKANIMEPGRCLNQTAIDKLIYIRPQKSGEANELKKGIQHLTLESIRRQLREEPDNIHTCETLSAKINLSKVTVRRYLNYLIELGELTSAIDYETGGRPSVIYRWMENV